jgi:hypothetical protein
MSSAFRQVAQSTKVGAPTRSRLIGLTLSVNYADKLAETLKANRLLLDTIYVVSSPDDNATKECCSQYGANIIICGDVHAGGASFNKSGLIRFAQKQIYAACSSETWILYFDADTILPIDFHEIVSQRATWRSDTIYEMRRQICLSVDAMNRDEAKKEETTAGFFQLYYDKRKLYPEWSASAAECDILFRNLFSRMEVLEGHCLHLGPSGLDWSGRVTSTWA